MDYEEITNSISRDRELEMSAAFPVLMRKVYLWMTMALTITSLVAYYVTQDEKLMETIVTRPKLFWGLIIAELVLVVCLSTVLRRLSLNTAILMLVVYSFLNGANISYIFLVYGSYSIWGVFMTAAGTYAAMAVFGYYTKTDLASSDKFQIMTLISVVIATFVSFISEYDLFTYTLNYLVVRVLIGLTAYYSPKIKQMMLMSPNANGDDEKVVFHGALLVYLGFIPALSGTMYLCPPIKLIIEKWITKIYPPIKLIIEKWITKK